MDVCLIWDTINAGSFNSLQGALKHSSISNELPGHSDPPFDGGGFVQFLVLNRMPSPHDGSQSPHPDHVDHPPSIGQFASSKGTHILVLQSLTLSDGLK